MYRDPASPDPKELPPAELVVRATARDMRTSAMRWFEFASLPLLAGVVLAIVVSPEAGLVGMVGTGALAAWRQRSRKRGDEIVLRVEHRELVALTSGRERARFRLGDLDDVALDTKTIRPIQEGSNPVPGLRFVDSRVGPEVDVARIQLVGDERRVTLFDEHIAHMDATEWLGKIRVFLRKHGWVPLDERDEVFEEEDDSD